MDYKGYLKRYGVGLDTKQFLEEVKKDRLTDKEIKEKYKTKIKEIRTFKEYFESK